MRGRLLMAFLGIGVLLAAWFAVRAMYQRRLESELRLARGEFGARRFGAARERLARLAERWPDHGEVEYLLGASEKALGHSQAAMAAWDRVPAAANQAPLADLSRGRSGWSSVATVWPRLTSSGPSGPKANLPTRPGGSSNGCTG